MRRFAALGLVVAFALGAEAAGTPNWEVNRDSSGTEVRCTLVSSVADVNDGYQTVHARIRLDDHSVVVETPSDLDVQFSDIGLVLDDNSFVPMDRVDNKKRAVFESQYDLIVEHFKAGREVEARLRFWPEFPVTGAHGVTFSLIGFTKAFDEAMACK